MKKILSLSLLMLLCIPQHSSCNESWKPFKEFLFSCSTQILEWGKNNPMAVGIFGITGLLGVDIWYKKQLLESTNKKNKLREERNKNTAETNRIVNDLYVLAVAEKAVSEERNKSTTQKLDDVNALINKLNGTVNNALIGMKINGQPLSFGRGIQLIEQK